MLSPFQLEVQRLPFRDGIEYKLHTKIDDGCWMEEGRCWMVDVGWWMLDGGCWMIDSFICFFLGCFDDTS